MGSYTLYYSEHTEDWPTELPQGYNFFRLLNLDLNLGNKFEIPILKFVR